MYGLDLQKGKRLQPNTIWLQIHWPGLQITEKTTKSGQAPPVKLWCAWKHSGYVEWTFKKVKDFNQTPSDYKSIDLDYKLLKCKKVPRMQSPS
jgi:hypothetical protein